MINLLLDAAATAGAILSPDFVDMIVRFVVNTVVVGILVYFLYFPKSHRRDFSFTFQLVGVAIFFLVFFMMFVLEDMKGKTSIGIGIGLFGIFSIMRYRTETMPVREMTYMFLIIALSVINALAATINYYELAFVNIVFILAAWFAEGYFGLKHVATKLIQYDRIALITPDKRDELKADLEQRTGLKILKIEVGALDLLRDMAMVKITYLPTEDSENSIDELYKINSEEWKNVSSGQ